MLESYSAPARYAVSLATAEARRLKHQRVGTEHLLLGLLADGTSTAAATLASAGATLAATRHKVVEASGSNPGEVAPPDPELTPRARRAVERAGRFARQDRRPEVGTEHLLLGVLDVEGLACQVLRGIGVDLARLRDALVPEDATTAAATSGAEEEADPAAVAVVRPRCASCMAALDDTLTAVLMRTRGTGDAPAATVRVVYCAACGGALAVLPAHG